MTAADAPVALQPDELDVEALSAYLRSASPELQGELAYARFTAGHSNLTYLVRAGSREFVLKRQPPGASGSAHDMSREHRVLSALHGRYPLSPRPLLLCQDRSILGGDFVVMERLHGIIIRDYTPADGFGPEQRRAHFTGLIDALADLHRLDFDPAEVAHLGRANGYRQRQVEGWCKRYEAARYPGMVPADDIAAWLRANTPDTPQDSAVIHNDFKMDNLLWKAVGAPRLAGVLDWEMATIGDPLMDLACTLSFWVQPDDPAAFRALRAMPSTHAGAPSRREALDRYARRTGFELEPFNFYTAYGLFRRAIIEEQKYSRYLSGQAKDPRYAGLDQSVKIILEMSRRAMEDK